MLFCLVSAQFSLPSTIFISASNLLSAQVVKICEYHHGFNCLSRFFRAELQQTVTWIQTHLEVDPDVSLPKQDVYDEYM